MCCCFINKCDLTLAAVMVVQEAVMVTVVAREVQVARVVVVRAVAGWVVEERGAATEVLEG